MIRQHLAVLLLTAATLAGCASTNSAKPAKPAKPTQSASAAMTKATPRCADVSFPIYFRSNSTQLTDEAIEAIRTAGVQSKGCRTAEVRVLGLADADGSAQANQSLSEERAKAVGAALAAQGFPEPAIDLLAAGKQGATTAAGATAPQRRRAEVAISYKH